MKGTKSNSVEILVQSSTYPLSGGKKTNLFIDRDVTLSVAARSLLEKNPFSKRIESNEYIVRNYIYYRQT